MGSGNSRDIKLSPKSSAHNQITNQACINHKGSFSKIKILSEEKSEIPNLAFHKISKHRDEPKENNNRKLLSESFQFDLGNQKEDSEAEVIVNGKKNRKLRDSIAVKTLPPLASPFEISEKLKIASRKPDMKLIHDLLAMETGSSFEDFIEENDEEIGNETLLSILNDLNN